MITRGTFAQLDKTHVAKFVLASLFVGAWACLVVHRSAPAKAAVANRGISSADSAKPLVEQVSTGAKDFISDHCIRCHNDVKKTARLDLTRLAYDPDDRGNFALWVKIHDRVAAGEMPPEESKQPDPTKRASFGTSLAETFVASENRQMAGEGRSTQRRMNRFEYENALRDLLGVPTAQIANQLPQDGEAYRFNKSAEALDVSYLTMLRFISAADYAMRGAISQKLLRTATALTKLYARDEASLTRSFRPNENGTLSDRLAFPVLDAHAQQDVRLGRAPLSRPESREREAIGKVSSIFSDAGRYGWTFRAPATGRYHIKLAGYTIWVGSGGIGRWFYEGQGTQKAPVYYRPLWHRPELDEVWPGRNNEPIGIYASGAGQTRPVGACDFTPKPSVSDIDVDLVAGESISTDATRLFRTRVNGTDEQYVNPLATEDGIPGYAVQWLQAEGPVYDDSYGAGYALLFGDLPLRRVKAKEPGVSLEGIPGLGGGGAGRGRGGGGRGRGGFGAPDPAAIVEVDSGDPHKDAIRLLKNFISVAYRRGVNDADLHRFQELFEEEFSKGRGFAKSMLAAYSAVLASPHFVFIEERPGKLDDVALATRLSLFLWNSTPDENLRARAASGELHKPDVLRAQTRRLLDDPKSRRFVDAFTDYWLDLRKIDDTSPSSTIYNDYELDEPLKVAAVEETRLFFAELIHANLPARNVVDSDFTFVNERLATHYSIPGVSGALMRRVDLPADSLRGGVMTQAAILKVTANGTTTSPVIRGHWITERILGIDTPPPPPTVKAVEPDIRGAVTIRQQLEKHRADKTCALCHDVMDPSGFALESFDVMGAFRERYRAVASDVPPVPGYGINGQKLEYHWGLPADCTGELPDGRPFKDVRELKKLIARDERALARNLVNQLSVFATGAPVRFSDRPEIQSVLDRSKPSKYGVRTLIEELVQSEMFRAK